MADFFKDTYPGLIRMLDERRGLAEQYLTQAQKLNSLIENDETETIVALLDERAPLLDRIGALTEALKAPLAEYRALPGGKTDARAESLIDETRERLTAAQALDKSTMEAIQALKGAAADEGKKLTKSREGIEKYGQKDMIFSPGFFDQKQ